MADKPLWVEVTIRNCDAENSLVTKYVMDHNNQSERTRLAIGCRDAFEARQQVWTKPVRNYSSGY